MTIMKNISAKLSAYQGHESTLPDNHAANSTTPSTSNSIIQLSPEQTKQVTGGDPSGKVGEIEVND